MVIVGFLYWKDSGVKRANLELRQDSAGRLRALQSERKQIEQTPIPPLWKPEPDLLLRRDLDLTPSQRSSIEAIDADWRVYRDSVRRQAAEVQAKVNTGNRSVEELASGLQGFGEVSREYDETRDRLWKRALEVLDKRQADIVAGWQPNGGKK